MVGKKYWQWGMVALFFFLSIEQGQAFRDVPEHHATHAAIQYLLDKEALKEGSFFRPDNAVTAEFFWPVVLREAGFDPQSATFNTPLPANIEPDDELAQFLREGIRRGFIDNKQTFWREQEITKIVALKIIFSTKALRLPKHVSPLFRSKIKGVSRQSTYLPYLESAHASGILADKDLWPFHPHQTLTRRELVQWLYNFQLNGRQKATTIDPRWRTQKKPAAFSPEKKSTTKDEKTDRGFKIEILQPGLSSETNKNIVPQGNILRAIFARIKDRYRFVEEVSPEKENDMINEAIAAMVKELGDKYSTYIKPENANDFAQGLDGKYQGIGAYVEMINTDFIITAPIKGSPAEAAGLLPGDVVIEVDGQSIAGQGVREIIAQIKGEAGTEVVLTIKRNQNQQKITVVRGHITIPAITLEWNKSVPVIGIHQFNNSTANDLNALLTDKVLPKKPRGIVIDLRNNPGGLLTSAVEVGSVFLDDGMLIFSVEDRRTATKYVSKGKGLLANQPNIVVLQNKGTASASEIINGMLQDYAKATIIGTKSLGKGTVQEVVNYNNGGILKLTIAKWLTPKGRWIKDQGVIPDIVMEAQTTEQRQQNIDPPLDKAVNVVLGR